MVRGVQEKEHYGLYCKPHKGFAERTWFFSMKARDAAYDREKAKVGVDPKTSRWKYVKKMRR
jgi:hypothetical protein